MATQSLQRGLLGHCLLGDKAEEGKHGKAAILQLLQLVLLQHLGVLAEAKGVKCTSCIGTSNGIQYQKWLGCPPDIVLSEVKTSHLILYR